SLRDWSSDVCSSDLGPDGQGSHGEGAPLRSTLTATFVYSTAAAGRKAMPAFNGVLSPTELRDVAGFITGQLLKGAPESASHAARSEERRVGKEGRSR